MLGRREYIALEAKGKGKFVGWNVTVGRRESQHAGEDCYPVDQNEKFFIDGEKEPSVEFQGMEDSFGFSWGFPETQSQFPLTGYYPFFKGACGYRFFAQDAVSFEKSLTVKIGFGKHEDPGRVRQAREPAADVEHGLLVPDRAARGAGRPAPGRRARPAPEDPSWAEAGGPQGGEEVSGKETSRRAAREIPRT